MDTKKDFRFNHRKYKSKKVSLKMIDDLMDIVISSGTSKVQTIIAAIKIVIFFAYLWVRKMLIDEQFKIEKQEYEQGRVGTNIDDLSSDDMD